MSSSHMTKPQLQAENAALKEKLAAAESAQESGPDLELVTAENANLKAELEKLKAQASEAPVDTVEREQGSVDLSDIQAQMAELRAMVGQALSGMNAKDRPITRGSPDLIQNSDEHVGQFGEARMSSPAGTGDEDAVIIQARPEIVESPEGQEKLANLAFMEEVVTIQVAGAAQPDAPEFFEITNGGTAVTLFYGGQFNIKRKYVEVMARAKITTFSNKEDTNKDGVKTVVWPSTTSHRYGFAVTDDPNPKGREWIQSVMAQP